jgi:PAS domain S-box-containing protein
MEDDSGLARLLQKKLSRKGYDVDVAPDGGLGLEMAGAGAYDVLLVDHNMPVHNGLDVIRMLSDAGDPRPIIMVTGAGDERVAARAMKHGAADYVVKDAEGGYLELLPLVIERSIMQARLSEEKSRAEEELRASEERYRTLTENIPIGLYRREFSERGRIISANPAFIRIFGYDTAEELRGVPAEDFYVDPGDRAVFSEAVERRGAVDNYEVLLKRRDGEGFWASVSARVVPDDEGRSEFLDGAVLDITERKKAAEALHESEERYLALFDRSRDCVYVHDFDGNFLDANAASLNLLGYSRDEIQRIGFPALLPEGQVEVASAVAQEIRETGTQKELTEYHLRRKDGTYVDVETKASVIYRDGEPYAIQGIARDITARKEAAEALRRERDRAQSYLDVAGVIMLALDPEGRIALINKKGCDVLGVSEEDSVGKDWFAEFLPEETVGEVRGIFEKIVSGNVTDHTYVEARVLTTAGEERVVAWHNSCLFGEAGEIVGTLSSGEDITERKRAEAALRDSEEKFRKISDTAQDAIIMMDRDGRISYWNRAAELIFGYEAGEVYGQLLHETIAPAKYRERYMEGLKGFSEAGWGPVLGRTLQMEAIRRGGEEFPVELSVSAVKIKGDWHALSILRDITARKEAEEELRRARDELEKRVGERTVELTETVKRLRESEEKYRDVVEQIQDGLAIIQDGVLKFYNKKLYDTLGYGAEELYGRPFVELVAPRERKRILENYAKRKTKQEVPSSYETVGVTKAGREIPVEVNISSLHYEALPAELVLVRDLTERHENEKVMREQRWVLENVLNNMSELVYVVHPATYEILFVNHSAQRVLRGEAVGQSCYRAVWGLEGPCHECHIDKAPSPGDDVTYKREAFNERLGKWLRVNIRAVPWLDGELVYCCVGADISESKALEEEIIAHNRALNQMVKERTAALENKNRELESFAYSVSHDLRAPLRSIEGFSRALMDDYRERLDEDGRDFLNRIVNGAVRMDRLINDLLTYSRLGRRGVEYELVDLNELVAVIREELGESIDAARGRLDVSGELPEVPGDRSMLLVLLQNLVGNAVKYHRAGVAPEVNISSHTRNGDCVVAVRDNGIGLDTKYQQKVFDIFQRLHTEDEYPGTGIGLASAKKVVEAHGGRIWYESEPGHGTTFYFKLPARRDDGDGGGG